MIPQIDWLSESARYLANFYDAEFDDTLAHLTHLMEHLRAQEESGWVTFGHHMLLKHIEEDFSTDWFLMRQVSSLSEFTDGSALALAHTEDVRGLPGVLDDDDST